MVIFAAATAGYVYLVSLIIDAATTLDGGDSLSQTKRYAAIILPVILGLTFAAGLGGYIQRILTNSIALNTVGKMQTQMLRAAHARDFADSQAEPTGELIAKFTNDVTVVSGGLVRVLGNLIKDVLTVIFTVGAMLYLNWQLSLFMVVFGFALWPIIEISKRLRGNAREVQEHIGHMTAELKESLGAAQLVKTYGLESREQARLDHSFSERIRLYLKLITQQARVDPILEVVGGLVIAAVVIFGVWQYGSGTATGGQIAGVLMGLLALAPRLRALGTLNNVVQESLSSVGRIFEVIDTQPTLEDAIIASDLSVSDGRVELRNVSFTYPDGTLALRGFNLIAEPGQTTALVGPSGGGKSTVMHLIPRLYDVTEGAVLIDGQDVKEVTQASLRRHIAVVSQDAVLFNDTIAANIALGDLDADRDAIILAAKAADAHDFIARLPDGYDTVLGEDGSGLSGGQKQRLSIARAILRDAPILLLDEATSALDTESEAKVQAALERLSEGRTTLVIAHRLETIRNADKICVVDSGRVVETGTDAELRGRAGIYAGLNQKI
ncbi:multidrug ABC transporter permease [Litorimonas cladophorae]|uniref:Multidrug ABC transporter permease n=2 Tax=Litorimonas cladophorae TaxID=1220491 RepID=A0A918NGQ9_9PROT|nr:multidrug ABC transporter permease [Litorimonas cladophorae]